MELRHFGKTMNSTSKAAASILLRALMFCFLTESAAWAQFAVQKAQLTVTATRYIEGGGLRTVVVPLYVSAPQNPGTYPLIVWSHGGLSTAQNIELVDYWAEQGYVTVAPAHLDSVEQRDAGASAGFPTTGNTWSFVNRAADVSMVLDEIAAIETALNNQTGGGYSIAADRPLVGGHSFGAFTAMAVTGAKWVREITGGSISSDTLYISSVIADGTVLEEAPPDTVGPSQRMNEELLRVMKREDVPHPQGANIPLVSPHRPQPSAAARHIIRKAQETPDGEKLHVAILGPCTNLASAVLMEPAIVPRVVCHFIGLRYDHRQKLWSRDEFNTNNDPNALDVLLNTPGLEFHLMTATASQHLVFEKAEVIRRWKGKGGVADHLLGIWEGYRRAWQERIAPTKATWTMWDIALIEALARPELAKAVTVDTPPENRRRPISVWIEIDVNAMRDDFWQAFER
jgi:predicted dienelactone hydrolase